MGVETIADGIKTRLDTITALRKNYATKDIPEDIPVFPAAIIVLDRNLYHQTFAGGYDMTFKVIVLFARIDNARTMDAMLPFVESSGNSSVLAAIEGDRDLGNTAADCKVIEAHDIGAPYQIGNYSYQSVTFDVAVWSP